LNPLQYAMAKATAISAQPKTGATENPLGPSVGAFLFFGATFFFWPTGSLFERCPYDAHAGVITICEFNSG
jgi:hypothetical protein